MAKQYEEWWFWLRAICPNCGFIGNCHTEDCPITLGTKRTKVEIEGKHE